MENQGTDGILWNTTILDAILMRHLLAYTVADTGEARVVEPHAYGVSNEGDHVLIS